MAYSHQIWVDTGGTFTDCIIRNPHGNLQYLKVLSDGTLRANVKEKISDKSYRIDQNWPFEKDVLKDYLLLQHKKGAIVKVESFDVRNSIIHFNKPIILKQGDSISLGANEEAPILAIRLGLGLTLDQNIVNSQIKLGTTKGTNALLERKGAKVLLFCTKGFKDLSIIGTQQRPNIFQLAIPPVNPLFEDVIEVDEWMSPQGDSFRFPESNTENPFESKSFESIAIAYKNAYANDAHEQKTLSFLKKHTDVPISVSSMLDPEIKLLNRTQSTLINAYLDPILNEYLDHIREKTEGSEINVMSSMGNLLDLNSFRSVDSLLSGPAGGLKAASFLAKKAGRKKVISFDMGGTSTDVSRFDGKFDYQYQSKIAGLETNISTLNIETVAAGGGSICMVEDGLLKVGPESAGAFPGPACYGQGGPLCITDVNLLLGKLDPQRFQFPLSIEIAKAKLEEMSRSCGIHPNDLLMGFEKIGNQIMANAIEQISIKKGFDPSEYSMVSFGGAGGMHACKIAEHLKINEIYFPYESGLLSAYGIGQSVLEKVFKQRIARAFQSNDTLENQFKALELKIQKEFSDKNLKEVEFKEYWINIAIKGQDSSLDIPWERNMNLESEYRSRYLDLFGFLPEDSNLEINSIYILAGERDQQLESISVRKEQKLKLNNDVTPMLDWEALQEGVYFSGSAVISNPYGTVYLENGWEIVVGRDKLLVANHKGNAKMDTIQNEVIQLSVFSNRLQQIAEEMGLQLQKTAKSINVKERLDFSCGILNEKAELVANAPHIPVHLGSLGICARLVLEKLECGPGDIIICNHPKYGGSHLPDITLLMGVYDEEYNCNAYVINRSHHAEIGGKSPGSMPPDAINLEEEGVVFEPMYLAKSGQFFWNKIQNVLENAKYPSRNSRDNIADLKAAVASLKSGERAINLLANEKGKDQLKHLMNRLLDNSSTIILDALKPYENKILYSREYLDDGRSIQLSVRKENDQWIFNFEGTGEVERQNLNANISIVHSAVMYVLRLIANRDIPLNEGLMKNISLEMPECLLNPVFLENPTDCPAVVGGNTEVSQRLVDTMIKCFELSACSQGTMNNLLFGNDRFSYYETIGGGVGATAESHGRDATHQHMTNTRITDPEDLEYHFPVFLHEFGIRKDSGGNGNFKGGNGIERKIEFREDVTLTLLTQHRIQRPFGLKGGSDGLVGEQIIIKKNGEKKVLKGRDQAELEKGDAVLIRTPGGGGYGIPK